MPAVAIETEPLSATVAIVAQQSQIYYDQIMQAEGVTALVGYHCYSQTDGCQGETLGTGTQHSVQSMITGCTPRH